MENAVTSPPDTAFDVWPTPIAADDFETLPNDVDKVVGQKLRELQRQGCAAVDYRLSGADVEHICIVGRSCDGAFVAGEDGDRNRLHRDDR